MADTQPTTTTTETAAPSFLSPQEMNADQLSQFMRDGKMIEKGSPEPTEADPNAEAAAAKPAEQAAPTGDVSTADPASATPEKKKQPGQKQSAAERNKVLDEENRSLREEIQRNSDKLRERRELRELRARQQRELEAVEGPEPARETPKPQSAAAKQAAKHPDAPKIGDYDDPDVWAQELAEFVATKVAGQEFERRSAEARTVAERDQQAMQAMSRTEERAAKEEARYPGWREQMDPSLTQIPPLRALPEGTKPHFLHVIRDEALFESENPIGLGIFMSTDEGRAWVAGLQHKSESEIRRAVMRKDLDLSDQAVEESEAAPTSVSKAPAPTPVAGRKAAAGVDPLKKAIADGDYLAFERLENAKLLAGRGK